MAGPPNPFSCASPPRHTRPRSSRRTTSSTSTRCAPDITNEGKTVHKLLLESNKVLKVSKGAPLGAPTLSLSTTS